MNKNQDKIDEINDLEKDLAIINDQIWDAEKAVDRLREKKVETKDKIAGLELEL